MAYNNDDSEWWIRQSEVLEVPSLGLIAPRVQMFVEQWERGLRQWVTAFAAELTAVTRAEKREASAGHRKTLQEAASVQDEAYVLWREPLWR